MLKIALDVKLFIGFRTVKNALKCEKIKEKSAMLNLKLICHSKIEKKKTEDKSLSSHISHQKYRNCNSALDSPLPLRQKGYAQ